MVSDDTADAGEMGDTADAEQPAQSALRDGTHDREHARTAGLPLCQWRTLYALVSQGRPLDYEEIRTYSATTTKPHGHYQELSKNTRAVYSDSLCARKLARERMSEDGVLQFEATRQGKELVCRVLGMS